MARSNILAGFCDNCSAQIFVGMKFCGTCGKHIDAHTRLIPVNVTQNSQMQPTTPYILANPTDLDIYQALISSTNPYASWGILELDDNASKIWEEPEDGRYAGNVFLANHQYQPVILSKKGTFRNFAYQAQIALKPFRSSGGLVFRAASPNEVYYTFSIEIMDGHGNLCFLTAHPYSVLYHNTCNAINEHKPNLLAIVVQDNIIDLYINLQHIARVTDTSVLNAGFVGVKVGDYGREQTPVSYAKVWIKEESGKND